jgi:hypothetical protein
VVKAFKARIADMTTSLLALILLLVLLAITIIGLVKSNASSKRLHETSHHPDRFDARRE